MGVLVSQLVSLEVDIPLPPEGPPWAVPEGATVRKSHVWDKAKHDWYMEDEWVSRALFRDESFPGGRVLDPFCGTCRILNAAHEAGYVVAGQDIVDRRLETKFDIRVAKTEVLVMGFCAGTNYHIVTNPPYDLVNDLLVSMQLRFGGLGCKAALFLPLAYAAGKAKYLKDLPLTKILVCKPRPNCLPGELILSGVKPGGGAKDYAWFIFDPKGFRPELAGQLGWIWK